MHLTKQSEKIRDIFMDRDKLHDMEIPFQFAPSFPLIANRTPHLMFSGSHPRSVATSHRRRAVGDIVVNLTDSEIESMTSRSDRDVFNLYVLVLRLHWY